MASSFLPRVVRLLTDVPECTELEKNYKDDCSPLERKVMVGFFSINVVLFLFVII